MIDSANKLKDFLVAIKNENILAIDTEFYRVDSYYPKLCLIQIATKNATVCIDVLKISNLEGLFDKLYDPQTLLIMHSGRADLEVLFYLTKKLPTQLFDTQIMANFLGFANQISYKELVNNILKVKLDKKYNRFDWRIRPLPKQTIEYAKDDIYYLFKLFSKFKNYYYLNWVLEDTKLLLNANIYKLQMHKIYQKIKGWGALNVSELQLANALAIYREKIAIKKK